VTGGTLKGGNTRILQFQDKAQHLVIETQAQCRLAEIGKLQPSLISHFLFNRLTLGSIKAAAAIGGTKFLKGVPVFVLIPYCTGQYELPLIFQHFLIPGRASVPRFTTLSRSVRCQFRCQFYQT
jgi:hypothetical protein